MKGRKVQVFVRREQQEYAALATEAIATAERLSPAVAELLCQRGIDTPEAAHAFLHPDISQLHDPMGLPDMKGAVARLRRAIAEKEQITVFCDYDADGICGGSALQLHLCSIGAAVDIFSPNRHLEGYGLSTDAVRRIAASGTTLIVTVDCGVTNVAEVQLARELGVEVIVTDHHECGDTLPDTPWIINPKREDSGYAFPFLAGCGVAFKLICALSSIEAALRYVDLTAIGTITDIVPLLGENRVLAYLGVQKLRKSPSPGVAALASAAGISLRDINSQGVSFGLGPRINAAGRMDTAEDAIMLFCAAHPSAALAQLAKKICELNEQRKKEVDDIVSAAEHTIMEREYYRDSAIVLADRRWNAGVIGIAAARLAEKFTRPCVLLGGAGTKLSGSARSAGGVNIYEALATFSDQFEKFGGHAQAAGLTIRPEGVDALRKGLTAYILEHYGEEAFAVQKLYDMELTVDGITKRFVEDMGLLEPFGACNEKPAVLISGGHIADAKFVGKNGGAHLKFKMGQNGADIDAVRFFHKSSQTFLSQTCDFICEPGINDFNGKPQLVVRELSVHFDEALTEGFLQTNKVLMAERFLDEIMIAEPTVHGEAEFVQRLEAAMRQSRFSLCVEAGTEPALKRLIEMQPVRKAMEGGKLCLHDPLVFTLDNCLAAQTPQGYDRVLYIGKTTDTVLWDETLREDYRRHAAAYFVEREALLTAYRKLCAACGKPGVTAPELRMGLDHRKTAFARRVLTQLQLIGIDKSGRIHPIPHSGPKKALRDSACYACIEDMVHGR